MSDRTPLERAKQFVVEKIPFFLSGLVATGVNYGMYLFLVDRYLHFQAATIVAYSSSVLLNFVLQRYFVFELRRSVSSAFGLSMLVSLGGLLLDSFLIYVLHNWIIVSEQEWIIKGLVTGLVFFYNFYLKRLVFEGR
ncbi:MAG: GtrA family protein [Bacteroidota bacterium]